MQLERKIPFFGGILVIINLVLSNIILYMLYLFQLSKGVLRRIFFFLESIQSYDMATTFSASFYLDMGSFWLLMLD
jgi:hypothetical protein